MVSIPSFAIMAVRGWVFSSQNIFESGSNESILTARSIDCGQLSNLCNFIAILLLPGIPETENGLEHLPNGLYPGN